MHPYRGLNCSLKCIVKEDAAIPQSCQDNGLSFSAILKAKAPPEMESHVVSM